MFLELSHLEQQLEEANAVRQELDEAFRQIKAYEKQIKTLQQEREDLNKVKYVNRSSKLFLCFESCIIRILKAFIMNYNNT